MSSSPVIPTSNWRPSGAVLRVLTRRLGVQGVICSQDSERSRAARRGFCGTALRAGEECRARPFGFASYTFTRIQEFEKYLPVLVEATEKKWDRTR
jgi:hypothetical protein